MVTRHDKSRRLGPPRRPTWTVRHRYDSSWRTGVTGRAAQFSRGNLLPQQVIITPLYRLYLAIHLPEWISGNGLLYNSYAGLIVINVSFQLGFCVARIVSRAQSLTPST